MNDNKSVKTLLEILEKDARIDSKSLAAMLDKEQGDIKKMISDLENDGTILGYTALVDWDKTDKEYVTAIIELKVTPQRDRGFDKVAERIYNFPEVKNMYLMSGGYDFSVVIEGKTMKEVAFFVAEKLAPIESIVSTATHFVLRKYKHDGVVYARQTEVDERGNCN